MAMTSKGHEGTRWLAMSFLVILFLDSLADVSFVQKIVLVIWCFFGKVYLFDFNSVEVMHPIKHLTTRRQVHLPRKKVETKCEPPRDIPPLIVLEEVMTNEKPMERTPSMASTASTCCDSPPLSPASSNEEIDAFNVGLNAEDLKRVQTFRTMLHITEDSEFLFTDDYLHCVLSVPNRTMEYAAEKLNRVIAWRTEYKASTITAEQIAPQLRSGSMYWYGYDYNNRPILWLRPKLKDWSTMDKELEIQAHVFMLELAIKELMPPGVTSFTLVTDCANVGYRDVDMRLTKGMIQVCQGNYPDRIDNICIGPLTMLVKTLTKVISPLLPKRLRDKAHFMDSPATDLVKIMPSNLIPIYLGGTATHSLNANGEPNYFDYNYMLASQKERLQSVIQTM